jgi:predicted anti-sigma-YlaC factor YlaD
MLRTYLIDRILEPSTIRGIMWIITAITAFSLRSSQDAAIAALTCGASVIGIIGAATPDKVKNNNDVFR